MKSLLLSLLAVLTLTICGCTVIDVRPVPQSLHLKHVAIRNNPKVIVEDFVPEMRNAFTRHGVTSEVISEFAPPVAKDKFEVTYTCLRSWDFVPYVTYAEVHIFQNGHEVGVGNYRMRGKGGFDPMKFHSVKTKMAPVYEQLLAGAGR